MYAWHCLRDSEPTILGLDYELVLFVAETNIFEYSHVPLYTFYLSMCFAFVNICIYFLTAENFAAVAENKLKINGT